MMHTSCFLPTSPRYGAALRAEFQDRDFPCPAEVHGTAMTTRECACFGFAAVCHLLQLVAALGTLRLLQVVHPM